MGASVAGANSAANRVDYLPTNDSIERPTFRVNHRRSLYCKSVKIVHVYEL